MWFEQTVFWALSAVAIAGALGVVLVRDLFRASLLLALVFVAVGGLFVMMNAEFLAVVQILIYVGAIAVLFIFAVMLTRDVQQGNAPNRLQIPAALVSALLLAAMAFTAVTTDWTTLASAGAGAQVANRPDAGRGHTGRCGTGRRRTNGSRSGKRNRRRPGRPADWRFRAAL